MPDSSLGDCPICSGATHPLDRVDFNKSCEEARGKFLPPSGEQIQYVLCPECGFSFAPQLYRWSLDEFEQRIYNDDYVAIDPDYVETRPLANAKTLQGMFDGRALKLRHLDYGGGSGLLSDFMRDGGWQSESYDPFMDRHVELSSLGKFNLITAFEVFEHVPDPQQLVQDLVEHLDDDGIILFTTMTSDGNLAAGRKLDWWYASPRNGHISLYSAKSLWLLAAKRGLNFGSFSEGFHVYWKQIPAWATHVVREGCQATE